MKVAYNIIMESRGTDIKTEKFWQRGQAKSLKTRTEAIDGCSNTIG
jgi:hypothetical protein